MSEQVRQHYAGDADEEAALAELRRELEAPGQEGLAVLDHFHVRGQAATLELAALAGLAPGLRVLDAGAGLGGASRTLAARFGCTVAGIDLTPSYVRMARFIAQRCGLAGQVSYEVGDMLELALPDGGFDVVWAEHVVMNIGDRDRLYREFARMLKPGGRLAFYDVMAAADAVPVYPTPWAESAASSFLLTETATVAALERAGFVVGTLRDVSDAAVAWFAGARPAPGGPSLARVLGARFPERAANLARNLREARVRVVMGVAHRPV